VHPTDPRNAPIDRAFEDARREGGAPAPDAEGSGYAGLPGADDEDVLAAETTSDPLALAQALRERKEREAALIPAAYGTFVAIVASHITAAGTAMIDKHEADLQYQDCDRMIDSMKRDGASTYCERHEDGSAVFIQKNTDRQKGEHPYIITVLKPRTGVYTYR
jgi:hypothetical protein